MEPENSLRTLADRLPSGILFQLVRPTDGAIRLNQISAGVVRLTGVSVAEALRDRETLLGLLVPDDRTAYLRAEAESLRTMTVLDTVVRSESRHGDVCWWQVRAAPRRLPDGSLALDGLAIDVTGPREAQERYRSLIDDQTEVVCRLLPDGTFVYVNDVYCRFFGRAREELLSGAWQPVAYPRDVPHVEERIRQLTPANPVVRIENRVFNAAQQLRWMEFVNRGFFGPDGVLREIQAVGRDITERKWAQLQLEVENRIAVAVAEAESLDAAGGLILPLLCATLEMEAGEFWQFEAASGVLRRTHSWAAADSPAATFLHASEGRTFAAGVGLQGATLAAGRAVWLTDLTTPNFLRQTEATAAGFRSGLGIPVRTGVVVLFATTAVPWDATAFTAFGDTLGRQLTRILDKKQAEEDLRRTLHQREVLLKEVHHRVKNNLQVISSLLRLQARLNDAGPARAVLRESQNRVRAIALVHENLYRAGDLEHVNALEYFRPLAAALASTHGAETRRIELTLDVEPVALALDQTVPCGLIVNELIANCFKHAFTDRLRGSIRLELRRVEPGSAELSVTDDGVGLPAAVETLGDRSLGFQLIRELAEQLAGSVTFAAAGGTRVVVRFPLRAPVGGRACP